MNKWTRKRSTLSDIPENSLNSRTNTSNRYYVFEEYKTLQNSISSLLSQGEEGGNFGVQKGKRGDFLVVEELIQLNNKNSSEIIIIELTSKLNDFARITNRKLESDWIALIISILSKVCLSCFRETKLFILKVALNENFLETLEKYVRFLKHQEGSNRNRNNHFLNNPKEVIVNLLFVCEFFIDIIPTNCCLVLNKLLTAMELFPCASEGANIEGRPKPNTNIKILREKLILRQKLTEQETKMLSVYPNVEEILTCGLSSEYFGNGKYENVKNYLDVQIQFLKDKFAEDIAQFIEHNKSSSIRIYYPDVAFQSIIFNWNELGVIVNFPNEEDLEQIFSPGSRRFECGSVVCFTKDNFFTIFFGRVIEKDCSQHHLIIGFEPEFNYYDTNVSFIMIDCSVNFYPYYYILQALKSMSDVDFPLKTYVIDGVPKVESPGYLDATSSIHLGQDRRVDVFGNSWPSCDELQLDSSQYSAFKAALTQKVVMVQGGPGTGKTYLGLKILKTLLHEENRKLWYNKTPILVVCLSNYVLDQFLEDLISTTSRIIKVGLPTKNDKLANFTFRAGRGGSYEDNSYLLGLNNKMQLLLEQLEKCHNRMNQIKHFNSILNIANFETIDRKIKDSWFSRASKADLLAWLFDEQGRDLHSLEISEIMDGITEEQKQFGSGKDDDAVGVKRNISAEPIRTILWSKSYTWTQILLIRNLVQIMKTGTTDQTVKLTKLITQLNHLWKNYQFFKMKISDRQSATFTSKPLNVDYQSPHSMDSNDRWSLYFHWLNLYKQFVDEKILNLQNEHRMLSERITDIRNMLDLEVMKRALVLGMTFTTAARLHTTLQSLRCRIVVVEEASQVSESQIMVSLTNHCKNLILLGNPSNETRSNFGINMLESLLGNNMQSHVLRVRHRTLPKMVELLNPYSYPELENDNSVTFPPILGMSSCYYFINHEHPEVVKYNCIANLYEAKFLVNFARYLRLVGYQAEDISILAAYSGQTQILCDESKRHQDLLKGVRICTLSDFQGQEGKIVLLSLVRSNTEGRIGNLGLEKFVILALTRAKQALYMMGNLDLLCEKSEIWMKVKEILVEQNCVGDYLPVCCQVNPDQVTKINGPKDFEDVIEEICTKICGRLLNCGLRCMRSGHILKEARSG